MTHSLRAVDKISSNYFALKIDMTKAFDRIEWSFLEKVLRRLGFADLWIDRIMTCVSSATFGVLINGRSYGHIAPSRGLREGDPLSPFLFILCADLLANGMRNAELKGKLTGIKFSSEGPSISHLLFADDSLFFCKANKEEASELKLVLNTYEKLSGQKINLMKSSITFGSKVSIAKQQLIKDCLGVHTSGGKGIYLGLPEAFVGSKIETLNFLEKKIASKVNSWKNRFLSLSGKETLIKAVALSLPTYSMACFKLPKHIYSRLSSLLARFWWKNSSTGAGIHWSNWEKLTKPKIEGGLGFRDLEGFNLALLGKQIWRLASSPNSLLARLLKSKYYPTGSILSAKLGNRPSFGWRSILEAQPLMCRGLKKEFGNGSDVSLLKDPWILNPEPRAPLPRDLINVCEISLGTITVWGSNEWNLQNLNRFFPQSEVLAICKNPITSSACTTPYSWLFSNNGLYTVKSGYWQWYHHVKNLQQSKVVLNPSLKPLFEATWKVKTTPKIQNFIWRCLSGNIAVGASLVKRKLIKNPDCPRCGFESESINHILFQCGFARLVWASSPAGFLFFPNPANSLFTNLASCLFLQVPPIDDYKHTYHCWPWILWRIWKARNDICFSNSTDDARNIIKLAKEDCLGWNLANTSTNIASSTQVQPQIQRAITWSRPPRGSLKCNVDGSWKEGSDGSGVGWVLFDDSGLIKWHGRKTFPALQSALHTEATSLIWAMTVVDNLGFKDVIFEMDCRCLFKAIKDPHGWPILTAITSNVQKRWRYLQPQFSLTQRAANTAADFLAKNARQCPLYFADVSCVVPIWLRPFLCTMPSVANQLLEDVNILSL